jgi:hypothetical protein
MSGVPIDLAPAGTTAAPAELALPHGRVPPIPPIGGTSPVTLPEAQQEIPIWERGREEMPRGTLASKTYPAPKTISRNSNRVPGNDFDVPKALYRKILKDFGISEKELQKRFESGWSSYSEDVKGGVCYFLIPPD